MIETYRGHKISAQSLGRDRRTGVTGIRVRINGHEVYTYRLKTMDEVMAISRGDVDASIERPDAYAWSRNGRITLV
jgi:hypothetical protein